MSKIYISQANISHTEYCIHKGEVIDKEAYDALPERLKIKFKAAAGLPEPAGRNEIIGDTEAEKEKRLQAVKEDETRVQKGNAAAGAEKIKVRRKRKGK
ncbi:MAG: hypothetical protein R6W90_07610 [Ignavibacteriaceae bacterium]